MFRKLTVLGGSSPFTVALVDSLVEAGGRIPPCELVLHGRNAENLEAVRRYADARLTPRGWQVRSTDSGPSALDSADVVLHQIRYGGMAGREADEELATAYGLPADETLGPGALQAAIRMVPGLLRTARDLARYCPRAWVLNLTNPLSIAVAVMSLEGLQKCVGLCELPLVTVGQACDFLQLPLESVEWSYSGLNHRGFIHSLSHDGRDCLPRLVEAMGERTLGGVTAEEIRQLRAIPLKYYCLLRQGRAGGGRAAYLSDLREEIVEELRVKPDESPAALAKRYMEWYPRAVVPMLAAISADDGRVEVVNVRVGEIVMELKARVFADRVEPLQVSPEGPSREWIETFREQERAALAAALEPSRERIRAALAADPLVPERLVAELTESLCRNLTQGARVER